MVNMFEKCDNHHKAIVTALAVVMVVLTAVNMAFNYFVIAPKVVEDVNQKAMEREYNNYGGKDNYEKVMMVQAGNIALQFQNTTKEQIKEVFETKGVQVKESHNGNMLVEPQEQIVDTSKLVLNTPIYGKEKTPFSILEFGDLECPACRDFNRSGVLEAFVDKNSDTVNYIYKNFQFHSNAPMKWEAALCVNELAGWDKFYEYIKKHFAGNNINASKDEMIALAGELGVDTNAMTKCLDSGKYSEVIESDKSQGEQFFGVDSTPTVIIINNKNGKWWKLQSRSEAGFQSVIDSIK